MVVFVIIVILGIIGAMFGPTTPTGKITETQPSGTTQAQQQQLVTKSVFEMLPTRNDLSTEWQFSGNGISETINATGFDSGALMSVRKMDVVPTQVIIHIYKFDSIDNANNYYQTNINSEKQSGGYKEKSTSMVNASCYAGEQEMMAGSTSFIYCIKNNVVFYLRAVIPYASGASDDMMIVAKVIPSKIV